MTTEPQIKEFIWQEIVGKQGDDIIHHGMALFDDGQLRKVYARAHRGDTTCMGWSTTQPFGFQMPEPDLPDTPEAEKDLSFVVGLLATHVPGIQTRLALATRIAVYFHGRFGLATQDADRAWRLAKQLNNRIEELLAELDHYKDQEADRDR